MATISASLAVIGLVKVAFWIAGAVLAFHRKRAFLASGFLLAAASTTVRALSDAGFHVAHQVTNTFAVLAVLTAFLIVGSFVGNQPREERPDAWSL